MRGHLQLGAVGPSAQVQYPVGENCFPKAYEDRFSTQAAGENEKGDLETSRNKVSFVLLRIYSSFVEKDMSETSDIRKLHSQYYEQIN